MNSFFRFAVLAACTLAPLGVYAQEGVDWSGLMTTYAQGEAAREAAREGVATRGTKGRAAPTASRLVLTYTPSAAVRQQTVQRLTQRLRAGDAAASNAVAAAYGPGKGDYGQVYRTMLRGSGFTDNDAASALAAYLETGYRIVNDVQDDQAITALQDKALRNQAASLLGRNQALRRDPAAVARVGEEFKLLTVLLAMGWAQARQSGQLAGFRTSIARQFATQYHLDLQQFTVTNQGLRKK